MYQFQAGYLKLLLLVDLQINMKEFTAKILELNPDFSFYTEITLGFGQSVRRQLQLQYNIKILEDKKDKVASLLNSLINKEVIIKIHESNMDRDDPIPVQVEYINDNAMHINLLFEMIARGYITVTTGYNK